MPIRTFSDNSIPFHITVLPDVNVTSQTYPNQLKKSRLVRGTIPNTNDIVPLYSYYEVHQYYYNVVLKNAQHWITDISQS